MKSRTTLEPVVRKVEGKKRISVFRLIVSAVLMLLSVLSLVASFYRIPMEKLAVFHRGVPLIITVSHPKATYSKLRTHPLWYALKDYLPLSSKDVAKIDSVMKKMPFYVFPYRVGVSLLKGGVSSGRKVYVAGDYGIPGIWVWWLDLASGGTISKKLSSILGGKLGLRVVFFRNLVIAFPDDESLRGGDFLETSRNRFRFHFASSEDYPVEILLPWKGGYIHGVFSIGEDGASFVKFKGGLLGYSWLPLKRRVFASLAVLPDVKNYAVFSVNFSSEEDVVNLVKMLSPSGSILKVLERLSISPADFFWVREAGLFNLQGWDVLFLHGRGASSFYELLKDRLSKKLYLRISSSKRGEFEATAVSANWLVNLLLPSVRGKKLYIVCGRDTIFVSTMARVASLLNESFSSHRVLSRNRKCSSGEFCLGISRVWINEFFKDSSDLYFLEGATACGRRSAFSGKILIDPSRLYGYFLGYPVCLGFIPDGFKVAGREFYYHIGSALYRFSVEEPSPELVADFHEYIIEYCPETSFVILPSGVYRLKYIDRFKYSLEPILRGRVVDARCSERFSLINTREALYAVAGRRHVRFPSDFKDISTNLLCAGGGCAFVSGRTLITFDKNLKNINFTSLPESIGDVKLLLPGQGGLFMISHGKVAFWNRGMRFIYDPGSYITDAVSCRGVALIVSGNKLLALKAGKHGLGLTYGTPVDVGFPCMGISTFASRECCFYVACYGAERVKIFKSENGGAFKLVSELDLPEGKVFMIDADGDDKPDIGVLHRDEFHLYDLSI